MFQIGETVFYSGSGICRIDSITSREFGDEMRDYYVLIPEHAANRWFICRWTIRRWFRGCVHR